MIEDVIVEVAGPDVVPLIKLLKNKRNVSEFKLAESLRLEVNMVRNMLYRLYDSNLVSFIRKKDKKKGWYIYYWTFDIKRIKYLTNFLKVKRLAKLRERLKREQEGNFYVCQDKCVRLDFDQAMNFHFKCPECGKLIAQEDNTEKIAAIEKEIAGLEEDLAKKPEEPRKLVKKKKAKAAKKTKKKAKPVKKSRKKKHIKKHRH
jgi:transcription initiation factor TFIIE subunit alpha